MITFLTGLPGSGKTLRLIKLIREYQAQNRLVYVCNVDGLQLPGCLPLETPSSWEDLPDGAVVVCDEVQQFWPSRRAGDPPPHIRALSTHRHRGFDFVLVTQGPTMVDKYVRDLVGRHCHLVRRFGSQASHVYEWNECQDDPKGAGARSAADEKLWTFDAADFGAYKSATVHTHKFRMPVKGWLYVGLVVAFLALAAFAVYRFRLMAQPVESSQPAEPAPAGSPGAGANRAALTPAEWLAIRLPRIAGVPDSAPLYDKREVATYPRLLCIEIGLNGANGCRCYTQQATVVDTAPDMCRAIVWGGWFDPYREDPKQDATTNAEPAPARSVASASAGGPRAEVQAPSRAEPRVGSAYVPPLDTPAPQSRM